MRFFLKLVVSLVLGVVLGGLATWASVMGSMPGAITDGPWQTSLSTGGSTSDPYTRARVAMHGLFALNRSETIYYTASKDSAGDALAGNCAYDIKGRDPDARWWSITAYAADDFLIPNPAHRYSISKTQIARSADGSFVARVSPHAEAGNWIALEAGAFSLTLRLYNPGAAVAADPANAVLPSIVKAACS
jgi:hypothetical protein